MSADQSAGTPRSGSEFEPGHRTATIKQLLMEKGMASESLLQRVKQLYRDHTGPDAGKDLVIQAWSDSEFRSRLLNDPQSVLRERGYVGFQAVQLQIVANTPEVHNVVVCTQCSCFPWRVLGLPPEWYKQPPYRAQIVRHPRRTLREAFGLSLDERVELRVWDASSENRYMVLPQPPPDARERSPAELYPHVTRNAMMGVERRS